jgi:REP element-mobilizing transposase RayT
MLMDRPPKNADAERAAMEQLQAQLKSILKNLSHEVPLILFTQPGKNDLFSAAARFLIRAVREVCGERGLSMLAAHVRSTHIHVAAEIGDEPPAMVANAFKRRASRLMNSAGYHAAHARRWARGGSYVRVRKPDEAIRYVVERQGLPMDVYVMESDP